MWVLEPNAYLIPTRSTGIKGPRWWEGRKQGALNHLREPIEALTDKRGTRMIYPLPVNQGDHTTLSPSKIERASTLYGGTLFSHFGHLLLDLTRTYQLLRLFRRSKDPIWFHYPEQSSKSLKTAQNGSQTPIDNPLVDEWLRCLGIRKRVRLIRKTMESEMLVSSSVLYRDREFVTADFPAAARSALAPKLQRRLLKIEALPGRIAYFSRHKLQQGTTCFEGEEEVVAALAKLANVDVICPEELSIREKLKLFRRYRLITGFPQAALHLKYFVPYRQPRELADLFLFTAGPRSLNSNWVNLDRVYGFGDQVLDCTPSPGVSAGRTSLDAANAEEDPQFQRRNPFDVGLVVNTLRELASR